MAIPAGSLEVKHTSYPLHLAKHELGLIRPATKDDGTAVEVETYKKEVDADKNGTIEKDREILDTDGDGKVREMEVWNFFIGNLDYLAPDGVLSVIAALRLELKKYPQPLPPESKRFITYKALFTKASHHKDPRIQAAALEALAALEPGKTVKPAVLPPAPSDEPMCLEKPDLPAGYIEVPLAEITEKKQGVKRFAIIDGDTIKVMLGGKMAGVRFKGANTTEFGKGPTLESRLAKAEPGAIKAWEERQSSGKTRMMAAPVWF